MTKIIFVAPSGEEKSLDVPPGMTIMQAAVSNGIDGIVGECGGSAMCATCHVYLRDEEIDRVSPVSEVETEMLDCTTAERRATSRLSCQIEVTPDLDGLLVYLPESQ